MLVAGDHSVAQKPEVAACTELEQAQKELSCRCRCSSGVSTGLRNDSLGFDPDAAELLYEGS